MVARIDPELEVRLAADPEACLEAIVVASGNLEELVASLPDGVVVRHRFRLIRGLAVTASAGALLRLAELPTVRSIEPERSVHALEPTDGQP